MVNHLIAWSLDNRFVVMLLAVVLLGAGVARRRHACRSMRCPT